MSTGDGHKPGRMKLCQQSSCYFVLCAAGVKAAIQNRSLKVMSGALPASYYSFPDHFCICNPYPFFSCCCEEKQNRWEMLMMRFRNNESLWFWKCCQNMKRKGKG